MKRLLLIIVSGCILFNLTAQSQIHRVEGSPYPYSSQPDKLYLTSENYSYSEKMALQTLQGVLAQTKPEILRDVHGHRQFVEGEGIPVDDTYYLDFPGLLAHFADRLDGYILCTSRENSMNVAISLAGILNGVAIPDDIEQTAIDAGLELLVDVRGKDEAWALANYGDHFNKDIVSYQYCKDDRGLFLGDYSAFTGALQFWDPEAEGDLAISVYARMNSGAVCFGWGAGEYETVEQLSQRSMSIHPSDFSPNLSTLCNIPVHMPRQKEPITPFKVQEDVHTVCFVISDGDNIQWLSGSSDNRNNWANPNRARVNLGWTISPAFAELAPSIYKKYVNNTLTTPEGRNVLIAGPSGKSYYLPGIYPDLAQECALLNEYMEKADLGIVNIIDVDNGPHNPDEYLKQSNIDALFYYTYGANYTGMRGEISWYKDKPSIGGRHTLWGNLSSPESLAETLNQESTDIYSADGYSLVPVHVWSRSVDDVLECISQLAPNVRVVAPDEFVWLVRKNIKGLPLGTGNGLKGEYFSGMDFQASEFTQIDGSIEFDWGMGSPSQALLGYDQFSVRWTGEIQPVYSEEYTFYVNSDDGVRLTINDEVLFDSKSIAGESNMSNTIVLVAEQKYDITLEYVEQTGDAFCNLEWESASQVRQSVPRTQLYTRSAPSEGLVTVYADCDYQGFSGGLKPGEYTLDDLNVLGVYDNDIASLTITEGFKVLLFEDDNFEGASFEISSDNSCLNDWADRTSSLKVITNGVVGLEGLYFLKNRASNYNMDVTGGIYGTEDGINIQQWNVTPNINQQFQLSHEGNGSYKLKPMHSLKSIEVADFGKENGNNVRQWTYYGSDNQQFVVVPAKDAPGYYNLIARHSGKILEAGGLGLEANVRQWENSGQLRGQWELVSVPPLPDDDGTGLNAEYFTGMNFEFSRHVSIDEKIDFDWGTDAPNAYVNEDRFSVRWTGEIEPRKSGNFIFYINSDNGRRLWVNNELIIDEWMNDYGIEYSGEIYLSANRTYPIKVEYFEEYGGASCVLEWKGTQQPREVVPTSQLYPVSSSAIISNMPSLGMDIYPNPVINSTMFVELSGLQVNDLWELTIFNLQGNNVLQTRLSESGEVNLNGLPTGLYFVRVSNGEIEFHKVIIVK